MNQYDTLKTMFESIPPKGLENFFIPEITDKTITIAGEDLQTITFEFDESGKLIHWR